MPFERTYSDADLESAVAASRSWRGVLRALGLRATSASAQRSARLNAERLGLDFSHFTGQRRWSDSELAAAIDGSFTWREVQVRLGLAPDSHNTGVRAHALRLGIDTAHLNAWSKPNPGFRLALVPSERHLARAGSMLAASFFTLAGHEVCWPLEPCRYDLALRADGRLERVQVKTTSQRLNGKWPVSIATSADKGPYDPDDIDDFFIIDGELNYFLIPISVVAGRTGISLSAYQAFKVGNAGAPLVEALPGASGVT